MHFALIIHVDDWTNIEQSLLTITREICEKCNLDQNKFKWHAWEFFSEYKFKQLTFDERADFAYRIAKIIQENNGYYLASYAKKSDIAEFREYFDMLGLIMSPLLSNIPAEAGEGAIFLNKFLPELKTIITDPYIISFSDLLIRLEDWLSIKQQRGMIIIDRQTEYESVHHSQTLAALRQTQKFKYLIEKPLQGSGVVNVMLQITDVLGYITGGFLNKQFNGKNFPDRHSRAAGLVRRRLSIHRATDIYSSKNNSAMIMFAEILIKKLGITMEYGSLIKAITEGMAVDQADAINKKSAHNGQNTYLKFIQRKQG